MKKEITITPSIQSKIDLTFWHLARGISHPGERNDNGYKINPNTKNKRTEH